MWIGLWTCAPVHFRLFTNVTNVHKYTCSCMFAGMMRWIPGADGAGKPISETFDCNENVISPKNGGGQGTKKAVPFDTA